MPYDIRYKPFLQSFFNKQVLSINGMAGLTILQNKNLF